MALASWCAFSDHSLPADYPYLFAGLSVTALGMGLTTAPSTGAIMESLPLGKAGVGSAVNDTTRELGGALGVAVFGSVLASRYHAGITNHLASLPQTAHVATSSSNGRNRPMGRSCSGEPSRAGGATQ